MATMRDMLLRAYEQAMREERYRSQAAFARAVGITRQSVHEFIGWTPESGIVMPGLQQSTIDRWFEACGVTVIEVGDGLLAKVADLAYIRSDIEGVVSLLHALHSRSPDLAKQAMQAIKSQSYGWEQVLGQLDGGPVVEQTRRDLK